MNRNYREVGLILVAIGFLSLITIIGLNRAFASTVLPIFGGGTGTSTTPSYGKVLVGGTAGEYEYVATSTFGSGGGSGTVTSIAAGTGLTGGTITTSGTIALDQTFGAVWTAASSTYTKHLALNNASSTLFGVSGTLWTPVTSALVSTDSTGKATAYGGTSCTNQFVRSINGAGVATCNTVSLTSDVTGVLPIANGGTDEASQVSGGVIYFDGTHITSVSSFSWVSPVLTIPNASSTLLTNSGAAWINGELQGFDAQTGVTGQTSPMHYLSFKLGTSTTWTATSSASSFYADAAQIVMPITGTIRTVACATSAGTLELEASVNSTNDYYPASTTAGTYTFSNTFTKGQIMTVIGGNPGSSPTYATCTLGATQTP